VLDLRENVHVVWHEHAGDEIETPRKATPEFRARSAVLEGPRVRRRTRNQVQQWDGSHRYIVRRAVPHRIWTWGLALKDGANVAAPMSWWPHFSMQAFDTKKSGNKMLRFQSWNAFHRDKRYQPLPEIGEPRPVDNGIPCGGKRKCLRAGAEAGARRGADAVQTQTQMQMQMQVQVPVPTQPQRHCATAQPLRSGPFVLVFRAQHPPHSFR